MLRIARSLLIGALLSFPSYTAIPEARAASGRVADSVHEDHRNTPKLQLSPAWDGSVGPASEARARAFLTQRASDYGLPADLSNLSFTRVRESLAGTHYSFRQRIDGIDVERAEIIVSIAKDGAVYRVYNNTYPTKGFDAAGRTAALDRDAAFDAAWNRLRAHGDVLAEPSARLVWTPIGETFRLDWIVDLELSAPYGGWKLHVDATTGRVVTTEDSRLARLHDELTLTPIAERIDAYAGPTSDRRTAFTAFENGRAPQDGSAILANGTGVVFDPDPRTTLLNDNLQDGSPASAFTAAYFTRNLLDIAFNGTTYSLSGPYVNIINWDPPATAPSTTTTGNWIAERGPNSFNDAMTYFQLDQNQRYMQALGFTGAMGIQDGPIGTDTDGWNGADNSSYSPGTNRLTFGHGCVDDDQDVDVILHEYGHAINHDINPSWSGGDTGAMGEGFGDYWAGSYSYSTPNGPTYHPEWVFTWDGHGTGNPCWPGRIMNAFAAQYVHTTTYGAHTSIPGGFQSDELWSTPLFQSLLALDALGEDREDVDAIILEAQFGLGSGLKMRDMANAIIQTAQTLFPAGPHADVFIQKFLVHNIIDIPHVTLEVNDVAITQAGANGAADPGEIVDFRIPVTNSGTLGATSVSAVLSSSTPGVVILQGAAAYPDLGAGGSGVNLTDYSIQVPSNLDCGDPIVLSLLVSFDDGDPSQTTLAQSLGTGVPIGAQASVNPELGIPDNNATGIQSLLVISGTGGTVSANFNVDVNITHTYIGDLIVRLTSPSGTLVTLHNRTGGSADNIIGNYPLTLTPAQPLSAFLGQPLDGTWRLAVIDLAGQDIGVLHTWGINDVSGFECDAATDVASITPGAVTRFALLGNRPNPFDPSTAIRFAVPGQGANVKLSIFDVSGRRVRTLQDGFLPNGEHEISWNGLDEGGRRASAGIYFYRLESADFRETRKMVLMR